MADRDFQEYLRKIKPVKTESGFIGKKDKEKLTAIIKEKLQKMAQKKVEPEKIDQNWSYYTFEED